MSDPFSFHPELFEHRQYALDALNDAGFIYFTDFMAVDLDHMRFGLDVEGIPSRELAVEIEATMNQAFLEWRTPG